MNIDIEKEERLKELFKKRDEVLDKMSLLERERIKLTTAIWTLQDEMGTCK